ncbi:hypothetical protein GC106_16440 [Kibdelosporangium sp. 4NS15]|uniref:PE domain-containing protein n=2 Tax=Kibdelosporangium persicum TaxID=2698649 RepID=A0ABX2F0J3_9PSEU|nr:hypothetical protein [Kibdelosporangium persicum]
MIDKALRAAASLFGFNQGTGKWMFTDVRQLEAVISEWINARDAIDERNKRINRTRHLVKAPAPDVMSELQAQAFHESLVALETQSRAMYHYAEAYVRRLEKARIAYLFSDERAKTGFNGPHG